MQVGTASSALNRPRSTGLMAPRTLRSIMCVIWPTEGVTDRATQSLYVPTVIERFTMLHIARLFVKPFTRAFKS